MRNAADSLAKQTERFDYSELPRTTQKNASCLAHLAAAIDGHVRMGGIGYSVASPFPFRGAFAVMTIAEQDPIVAEIIRKETQRQQETLEMIASENHTSAAVMEAQGSVLTNKYAEGYPGRRYYGGCEFADVVEDLARERAKQLFGCAFANVQPHSGAQANAAVMHALIRPGDRVLGLAAAGHFADPDSLCETVWTSEIAPARLAALAADGGRAAIGIQSTIPLSQAERRALIAAATPGMGAAAA